MMKQTPKQVKEFIEACHAVTHASVSCSKGIFTVKKSYFYGGGKALDSLRWLVESIPDIKIVESGDHWHSFVGGAKAGTAKDSYVWVKFTIVDKEVS
jgi:hypothetical protein